MTENVVKNKIPNICKIILNFQVIVKSILDPDNILSRKPVVVTGLVHSLSCGQKKRTKNMINF